MPAARRATIPSSSARGRAPAARIGKPTLDLLEKDSRLQRGPFQVPCSFGQAKLGLLKLGLGFRLKLLEQDFQKTRSPKSQHPWPSAFNKLVLPSQNPELDLMQRKSDPVTITTKPIICCINLLW